jgi:flavin-dependent dehydrogenase
VRHDRFDATIACFAYLATPPDAIVEIFVEAVRDGWWYTAPLPGGRSIVALLTDASRLATGDDRALAAAIPAAIAARVTPPPAATVFRRVAADSARLHVAAAARWIAVGDAAATHDPLAAQGIDRALRSGLRAAEAIALALHDRGDALRAYAEMQRAAFDHYLHTRRAIYALERRWPDAGFWTDRRAAPATPGARGVFPRTSPPADSPLANDPV